MSRPFVCRRIGSEPEVSFFKPAGVPLRSLEEIVLTVDEAEALKLVDFEGKEQSKAAEEMRVSQPTLSRITSSARRKVAEAVSLGKALRISGGKYEARKKV